MQEPDKKNGGDHAQDPKQHVRYITEQQLEAAEKKQKKTGKRLWEILMSDLSLKSIEELLTYEILPRGKNVGRVMVESGYATDEELNRIVAQEEKEGGLRVGDILIDKGLISRAQLGKALIEQERTGHPLTRVLLNLEYVTPKQLSDALRLEHPSVSPRLRREKVIDTVLRNELLTREKLMELVQEAEESEWDVAELLVERGVTSANSLGKMLGENIGVPYVNLNKLQIDPEAVRLLPGHMIRSRRALPVQREKSTLRVAMSDPEDVTAIDDISMITGYKVAPMLAWERQLESRMEEYVGEAPAEERGAEDGRGGDQEAEPGEHAAPEQRERIDELVENVSVIDLVASIVEGAINAEATDIHLEPQQVNLRLRYRIDGVLYDVMTIPKSVQSALVSRVKILANMDITVTRLPQDGHYSMKLEDRVYDMRIATMPTSLGERVVIRLLNPNNVFLGLKQMGFSATDFDKVESLVYRPNGMFLATGPIGAGKTTTLYGALNKVNVLSDSIVTIEDPIEYELPGINQVQVESKVNRTFSSVLRAILRQDVDTMLVGEIRDAETATIAVRAAITGHLLFSTLHTRDAVSAITTLVNYGIARFLVTSAVTGIVNQRLIRRVCPHCKEEYEPSENLLQQLRLPADNPEGITFVKGRGCGSCYHTGYHGRTGVFEVLVMSDRIKELVLGGAAEEEIQHAAIEEGMTTLFDDAIEKLKSHITSAEDVIRTVTIHE